MVTFKNTKMGVLNLQRKLSLEPRQTTTYYDPKRRLVPCPTQDVAANQAHEGRQHLTELIAKARTRALEVESKQKKANHENSDQQYVYLTDEINRIADHEKDYQLPPDANHLDLDLLQYQQSVAMETNNQDVRKVKLSIIETTESTFKKVKRISKPLSDAAEYTRSLASHPIEPKAQKGESHNCKIFNLRDRYENHHDSTSDLEESKIQQSPQPIDSPETEIFLSLIDHY